jgi:cysteate synthase
MSGHYTLTCLECGKSYDDTEDRFLLSCTEKHVPSLLRARFAGRRFAVREALAGIFRYRGWLPVRRALRRAGRPVVFPSRALGARLGLRRLLLAVSGYWPERGARLETCSFKELEALSVIARRPWRARGRIVVASAGNTGRAFLQISSLTGVPVLVVVPESAAPEMWTTVARHPQAKLAVVKAPADYADAIEMADRIAELDGFFAEGGARNVARRDGLGTVILAAVETAGEIPEHYVQAVGSGTGAIGAWEANLRLIGDGRFGGRKMRLHLVQNSPFAIMSEAWARGSRQTQPPPEEEARGRIARLHSPVLANRRPPYALRGGVYDALADTAGCMYTVSGEEAAEAGRLFESLEGCDLDPAAQVALAGLIQAVSRGEVKANESVLLNVTGAGKSRIESEGKRRPCVPDIFLDMHEEVSASLGEALGGPLS